MPKPTGKLLRRFVMDQDQTAFAELVRRHGPMVLGLCRRILGDPHEADDAFQATFLVLVKKAGSLDQWGSLGNWLYTVAYRLALESADGQAANTGKAGRGHAPDPGRRPGLARTAAAARR